MKCNPIKPNRISNAVLSFFCCAERYEEKGEREVIVVAPPVPEVQFRRSYGSIVSESFADPISFELIEDPVIANDELVYERKIAEDLIRKGFVGAKAILITDFVSADFTKKALEARRLHAGQAPKSAVPVFNDLGRQVDPLVKKYPIQDPVIANDEVVYDRLVAEQLKCSGQPGVNNIAITSYVSADVTNARIERWKYGQEQEVIRVANSESSASESSESEKEEESSRYYSCISS
jgi:hypothetical protein